MSWKNIATEINYKEKVSVFKQMSSFSSMLTKRLYLTKEALIKVFVIFLNLIRYVLKDRMLVKCMCFN